MIIYISRDSNLYGIGLSGGEQRSTWRMEERNSRTFKSMFQFPWVDPLTYNFSYVKGAIP